MVTKTKLLSILCASSLLYIGCPYASSRDGVYGGIGLGGVSDNNNFTLHNLTNGINFSKKEKNTSFLGGLFLGYGGTNDIGFYFATEIGTYWPAHTTTIENGSRFYSGIASFSDELKVQDFATLDILPGYRFNETFLLYTRAGLTISQLSITQAPTATTPPLEFSQNKVGGRLGLGLNYSLTNNWGVGLDYVYTHYQEMSSSGFATHFTQKLSSDYIGISAFYTI